MKFKDAVEKTPGLENAYHQGFGALRKQDKQHLRVKDPRSIKGSVDVDSALSPKYPQAKRWDFGVGHQPTDLKDEVVYWIETHTASTSQVSVVLAKLDWLRKWLKGEAPSLEQMPRRFLWVSSGKTEIRTLSDPKKKQYAELGLEQVGGHFKFPENWGD